jgi:hypothetical protein
MAHGTSVGSFEEEENDFWRLSVPRIQGFSQKGIMFPKSGISPEQAT